MGECKGVRVCVRVRDICVLGESDSDNPFN